MRTTWNQDGSSSYSAFVTIPVIRYIWIKMVPLQGRCQGAVPPKLELLPPKNNMNLACFIRILATFVGRWGIFFQLCPLKISRSLSSTDFPLVPCLYLCMFEILSHCSLAQRNFP